MSDRAKWMVEKYGEVVSIREAGEILKVGRQTIYRLRKSGKLKTTCNGRLIDTVSIAHYIEDYIDVEVLRPEKKETAPKVASKWQIK